MAEKCNVIVRVTGDLADAADIPSGTEIPLAFIEDAWGIMLAGLKRSSFHDAVLNADD